MNTGLTTLTETICNSLMPWLTENSDPDKYKILNRLLLHKKIQNSSQFFKSLPEIMNSMGIPANNALSGEWEMFSDILVDRDVKTYFDTFICEGNKKNKIEFYLKLSGYAGMAFLQWIVIQITGNSSHTFRQYLLMKALRKIESLLQRDPMAPFAIEVDQQIIFGINTVLVVLYLEICNRYPEHIEPRSLKFSKSIIKNFLVVQSAMDESIKRIASVLMKKYFDDTIPTDEKTESPVSPESHGILAKNFLNPQPADLPLPIELLPHLEISQEISKTIIELKANLKLLTSKHKAQKKPELPVHIGTSETCTLLDLNKTTLKSYRDRGILSYSQPKFKGKIMYDKNEVLKLRESKKFGRTGDEVL